MYSQGYYQITKPPRVLKVSTNKLTIEQQIISFWDHYQFDTEVSHTSDAFLTQLHDLIHNQKVHQTLQLVQETDFSPKLVFCLIQMAMQAIKKHPPSALLLLLGCEPLTVSFNQRQQTQVKMQIYNALGTYYRQTKEYQKALLEFERALIDIRNYKLKDIAPTYLNMALLLRLIDQNQRALENSKKAVIEAHKQYLQKGTHVVVLAISFYIVGKQEQLQENNQQALQAFASGFKIVEDNLGEQHILTRLIKQVYEEFGRQIAIMEIQNFSTRFSLEVQIDLEKTGFYNKEEIKLQKLILFKYYLDDIQVKKQLQKSGSEKKKNYSLPKTSEDDNLYRSQQLYSEDKRFQIENKQENEEKEEDSQSQQQIQEDKVMIIQRKWRYYQQRFKNKVNNKIEDGKLIKQDFIFKGVLFIYWKDYRLNFLFYDLKILCRKRIKKRENNTLVINNKLLQHIFENKLLFEEMKIKDMLIDKETTNCFINLILKKISMHYDGLNILLYNQPTQIMYKTMVNNEKIQVTLNLNKKYNTCRITYQIKNSQLSLYQSIQIQYLQQKWRKYIKQEKEKQKDSIPIKKYVRYQGKVVKQTLRSDSHNIYYSKENTLIQINIQTPHSEQIYDSLIKMIQNNFISYWTTTTELNHVKFIYFLHKSLGTSKYILVRTTELIYNVIKSQKSNYTITSQIVLEPTNQLYHSKLIFYQSNLIQAIQYPNHVLYWYFGTNLKVQLLPIFSMIPQHHNDLHDEVVFDFKNQKVFKLKIIVKIQQFLRKKHKKIQLRKSNNFKVRYIKLAENKRYILTVQNYKDNTQKLIVNEFPSKRKIVLSLDEKQFELIKSVKNPIALFDFDKQNWKEVEHQYYSSVDRLQRLQIYYKDRHKIKQAKQNINQSKFICIENKILFSIREIQDQILLEACSLKARHYRQTLPITQEFKDVLLGGENPLNYIICDLDKKEMQFKGMQQQEQDEQLKQEEQEQEETNKEEQEENQIQQQQQEEEENLISFEQEQLDQFQKQTPKMGYIQQQQDLDDDQIKEQNLDEDEDSHGFQNEIVKSQESDQEDQFQYMGQIKEFQKDLQKNEVYDDKDKNAILIIQRYLKEEQVLQQIKLLVNLQYQFEVHLIQKQFYMIIIRIQNINTKQWMDYNLGRLGHKGRKYLKQNLHKIIGIFMNFNKRNKQINLQKEQILQYIRYQQQNNISIKEMKQFIEEMRYQDFREKNEDGIISEVQEEEESDN